MSAFAVSNAHIDALLTAGLDQGTHGYFRWYWPELTAEEEAEEHLHELRIETANQVGAMLVAEYYRSVNHRYHEDNEPEPYVYARCRQRLAPVALLKAVDCYEYQSCEHPEWKRSQARAFCQALRGALVRDLRGYAQARWHIDR